MMNFVTKLFICRQPDTKQVQKFLVFDFIAIIYFHLHPTDSQKSQTNVKLAPWTK